MIKEELFSYIELGHGYGARVDVRLIPEYPGFVRVVGFHRENRVIIEFYALGFENDAAFEFVGKFLSLDLAINSIEEYLKMPIEEWHNFNKSGEFPSVPEDNNLEAIITEGHRKLTADILNQRLYLPIGADFISKHSLWNSIEDYDEFMRSLRT